MQITSRVELLGSLRLRQGDRVITHFRTRKTGGLLAYLAYHRQFRHPREKLIDLFWPESDLEAGRQSLSRALSTLRQLLEPPGVKPDSVVLADRALIGLASDLVTTDVHEFEAAVEAAGQAEEVEARIERLLHAVSLYQGELLPGYFEDWVLEQQERLAILYLKALDQVVPLLSQTGRLDEALEYARCAVAADPLREEAHVDLIRLYVATGQPSAAQRQYRKLKQVMSEELDCEPTPESCALIEDLLAHPNVVVPHPALPLPAAPPSSNGSRAVPAPPEEPASDPEPEALPLPPTLESAGPALEGENRSVTALVARVRARVGGQAVEPGDMALHLDRLMAAAQETLNGQTAHLSRVMGGRLLVVFGVPRIREDDPERALRAALALQQAAASLELELSIGVSTGQAYVGIFGANSHTEVRVLGPCVERASRLAERAKARQTLVEEASYQTNRRAFEFTPVPSDREEGIGIYSLERGLPHPVKSRGVEGLRALMVGRDEEMSRLRGAVEDLVKGRGRAVCVVGEAGIGKSRLIQELRRSSLSLEGPAPLWLEACCLEGDTQEPGRLLKSLLRRHSSREAREDETLWGRRLVSFLQDLVERGDLAADRKDEMGPLLGSLLGARFDSDWDERVRNLDPERDGHRALSAMRDLLLALARRRPLALVFDDLHWAGDPCLDLVSLLMEVLKRAPILLICVYRPAREHRCMLLENLAEERGRDRFLGLHLHELGPLDSRRLLESLLEAEALPPSFKADILDRAHGNPLFLEEILRDLITTGKLQRQGKTWRVRGPVSLSTVPDHVQRILLSRLDRLAPEAKRVLQAAAVIGPHFPREVLAHLLPEGLDLDKALWELERQGVIYRRCVTPQEEYAFRHVLARETLYQGLLRQHRSLLHQRAAEALEALGAATQPGHCEALAHHYEQAGVPEKAAVYRAAMERQERSRQGGWTITYLERLLGVDRGLPEPSARTVWDL